jgi:RNA methyltransferase, TrmH family
MAVPVGAHSARLREVRELRRKKGRSEQRRFAIEGPTLLAEAIRSGVRLVEAYATREALARYEEARALEGGVPVYEVDEASFARISDVETPTGLLAVAELPPMDAERLFRTDEPVLALAGVGDPGNAGTLLRSAEAFGIPKVLFAEGSVEPHNPKVVRSAMGSLFRAQIATGDSDAIAALLAGWTVRGLRAGGTPLDRLGTPEKLVIVVGSERQGLANWEPLCTEFGGITMRGPVESLNAAIAGSIALYEATKGL